MGRCEGICSKLASVDPTDDDVTLSSFKWLGITEESEYF